MLLVNINVNVYVYLLLAAIPAGLYVSLLVYALKLV